MSSLRYLEIVARHRNQRNLSLSKESKKSEILPKKRIESALKSAVLKMKFSELSGTSPAGRPPGLGPEPNGKGVVVNNIPTPSPNWTLLRLRPLPIVRNSKNVRCSTTCYFNHCILHYTLLHYIRFESNILVKRSTDTTNSEAYPEPSQISKIELLVKIVNG